MAEFTREQLIAEVHYNLEHCFCSEKTKRLMEIALAALNAEPVGDFYHEERWGWYQISEGDKVPEDRHIPLYRLPLLEGLK